MPSDSYCEDMKPQLITTFLLVAGVAAAGAGVAVISGSITTATTATPFGPIDFMVPVSYTSPLPTAEATTTPVPGAGSTGKKSTSEAANEADDEAVEDEADENSEVAEKPETTESDHSDAGDFESEDVGSEESEIRKIET